MIVAAYNYARYLPEALDSVSGQTFGDWRCVIVDDGSTDSTPEIAKSYASSDARFLYIRQENRGPSAARNAGIRSTSSEFLQFLDADDRLHERKLEEHVRFLDEHPGTDIVYSEMMYFRSEEPDRLLYSLGGKLSRSILSRVHGNAEALQKLQHYSFMPNPAAALARRSVVSRAGMFEESARGGEDYAFWLQCAVAGCDFQYHDFDPGLAFVRSHDQSASRSLELLVRGLITLAKSFPQTPAFREWKTPRTLPLLYEVALGIDEVEQGHRLRGARRIASAASRATESPTALRWRTYMIAAWLPRSLFMRVVTMRIPERPFEWYRRMRSVAKRFF